MLFFEVVSWAPERRLEMLRRLREYLTTGEPLPKKEGEQQMWWDIHGNRYFELVKRTKPREPEDRLVHSHRWLDIVHIDAAQVMEINDVLKLIGND